MASSTTTPSPSNAKTTKIGYFVQLGGAAAFALGGILCLHHIAIGAAFAGGAAAFYAGHKIRSMV
jgi:hypothetical protein